MLAAVRALGFIRQPCDVQSVWPCLQVTCFGSNRAPLGIETGGGLRKEQGRNSDPETGIPASVQADEAGALPGIEAGKN